ncbi:AbiJ-NTD4 domain-containing protein [Flavobacterium sp. KACC 22763]|uniref:AbiJ-NTD4 domain-containing protein n=1 Tax=Flavobacterium sp. KACC 22763 TaxID=3025668 RepID=UPI00236561B5|nr:hypothetical protein [Flavobacterium sp. KACC 22763]WDF64775.1 hypothetical protein PQ463_01205 [Flavobacterium sp. KACC 22763]
MSFSQRIGKKPLIKNLQLESIDTELRNGLWNILKLFILDKMEKRVSGGHTQFHEFGEVMWLSYFKLPVDNLSTNNYDTEQKIRDYFFRAEWYEVYDFLEFVAQLNFFIYNNYTEVFVENINHILETEFSAYRFIDKMICPISNSIEIDEIEEALVQNNSFTSLNGVNIHLENALDKLSDRANPDYRNSIKESISALETALRIITNESTLGKALNTLGSKGIKIDEQLKIGYEKIYAFTNNKQSGIRHAIVDEHNKPDFEDAKFILLLSSSMINYLVGKCKNENINIK